MCANVEMQSNKGRGSSKYIFFSKRNVPYINIRNTVAFIYLLTYPNGIFVQYSVNVGDKN